MLDPDCPKCKELDTSVKGTCQVIKDLVACIEASERRNEGWKAISCVLLLVCISEGVVLMMMHLTIGGLTR